MEPPDCTCCTSTGTTSKGSYTVKSACVSMFFWYSGSASWATMVTVPLPCPLTRILVLWWPSASNMWITCSASTLFSVKRTMCSLFSWSGPLICQLTRRPVTLENVFWSLSFASTSTTSNSSRFKYLLLVLSSIDRTSSTRTLHSSCWLELNSFAITVTGAYVPLFLCNAVMRACVLQPFTVMGSILIVEESVLFQLKQPPYPSSTYVGLCDCADVYGSNTCTSPRRACGAPDTCCRGHAPAQRAPSNLHGRRILSRNREALPSRQPKKKGEGQPKKTLNHTIRCYLFLCVTLWAIQKHSVFPDLDLYYIFGWAASRPKGKVICVHPAKRNDKALLRTAANPVSPHAHENQLSFPTLICASLS
eukprot:comp23548_c0_seq1/m.39738 comp23548_c0_seq1/g.39738  ORF comp23548_c0_seq1/g.39738 comp23548_c0_seq1/m.39738 type:complete len:363 (+) comp23548_c0_seq1:1300-2388(+)